MPHELREFVPQPSEKKDPKQKKDYTEYPGGLNRRRVESGVKAQILDQVSRTESANISKSIQAERQQEKEARLSVYKEALAAFEASKVEAARKVKEYEADLKSKGFRRDIEHYPLKRAREQAIRGDETLRKRVIELEKAGRIANDSYRNALQRQPKEIRKAISARMTEVATRDAVSAQATREIAEARDRAKRLARSKEAGK